MTPPSLQTLSCCSGILAPEVLCKLHERACPTKSLIGGHHFIYCMSSSKHEAPPHNCLGFLEVVTLLLSGCHQSRITNSRLKGQEFNQTLTLTAKRTCTENPGTRLQIQPICNQTFFAMEVDAPSKHFSVQEWVSLIHERCRACR